MTTPATQAKPPAAQPQQATAGQPIKVIVEKIPDDKHDYGADLITGTIGIVGALLGAWVGAKVTASMATKQKAAEDRERDDVAIQSIIRTVNEIYTFTTSYVADVSAAESKVEKGEMRFLSAALMPYANYPAKLHISAEEIYRARRVGTFELSNMITDFDSRFNSLLDSLTMYRAIRTETLNAFAIEKADGTGVTGSVDKAQEERFKADFNAMDHLIKQTKGLADELRKESYHAMIRVVECMVEYFGRPQKLILPDLNAKQQTIELKPTGSKK